LLLRNASFAATFPFIVLMPQCPVTCLAVNRWTNEVLEAVDQVLDKVRLLHKGDPHRTALTGQSMGGHGAWLYAMARPNKV
jgi:dienelactone hydrolase